MNILYTHIQSSLLWLRIVPSIPSAAIFRITHLTVTLFFPVMHVPTRRPTISFFVFFFFFFFFPPFSPASATLQFWLHRCCTLSWIRTVIFFFFFVFFQHLHRRFFDISVFIELLKENLKQNLFVLICSFNSVSYLSLSLPLVKSNPPFFSVHIHLFLDSLTNYRSNLALPVFICALSLFLFLAIFNEHLAEVYEFMKYERTT